MGNRRANDMSRFSILFFLFCCIAADASSLLAPAPSWDISEESFFVANREVSDDPFLKSTISDFWLVVKESPKEIIDDFFEWSSFAISRQIRLKPYSPGKADPVPLFLLHLKLIV